MIESTKTSPAESSTADSPAGLCLRTAMSGDPFAESPYPLLYWHDSQLSVKEYCQIEKLANLDQIPRPHGFYVSCLPVKIAGASAGWCRAVAMVPE